MQQFEGMFTRVMSARDGVRKPVMSFKQVGERINFCVLICPLFISCTTCTAGPFIFRTSDAQNRRQVDVIKPSVMS
jgi:hypothetical protein